MDFVGGPYFNENLASLALDGVLTLQGNLGGLLSNEVNLGPVLSNRLTIKASTLRSRSYEYKVGFVISFLGILILSLLPLLSSAI